MEAQFLGTGTSCGIPEIGCGCAVCLSSDPRDRRRRTSLYVSAGPLGVLVDTPPDFREQALAYEIPHIDAVFFTHAHADHIFGFDDIRRYNTLQKGLIPAYAGEDTLAKLTHVFDYMVAEHPQQTYCPQIVFRSIVAPLMFGELRVSPLPVVHGTSPTQGYRFEHAGHSLAYIPDCKEIPPATEALLEGVDVMILDALRHRPHPTHMTVSESLAALARIRPRQAYLTHLCHEVGHAALSADLPRGVAVAYDGLSIDLQCHAF